MLSNWAARAIDEAAERERARLAEAAKTPKRATRMYAGARYSRLTANWLAQSDSADSELWSSLTALRNRSRQLIRDNSYAKRAKLIVVNNVVGSGIAMEPNVRKPRGALLESVNDDIEGVWDEWSRAENCHTGGKLCFADMERHAFGQIFEAGEVLIRKHYTPFGNSKVPLGLELIEAERIADDVFTPVAGVTASYRLGVERDEFGRPLGFWLRKYHPGEIRYAAGDPNALFRVPAEQAYHLYIVDRWPQTRGEPWLHAAMRRLNDMDGYAEAEIIAARGAACRLGFITTPDERGIADAPTEPGQQPQFEMEPGAVTRLAPGEVYTDAASNRPNAGMDPFMRLMLREVAAGVGPSYESLSRDYSQSNYSSSRLALLDDRDLWRVFQQFFIRSFREPLHREWLQQAVLARAIASVSVAEYVANRAKFEAVSFKPRGWSWVDPTTEVEAYIKARRAGFMSTGQIIAQTGGGVDRGDVWEELETENQEAAIKGLILTTDPAQVVERGEKTVVAEPPADPAAAAPPAAQAPGNGSGAYSRIAEAIANIKPPVVNISPQPVVVNTPAVHVDVAPPVVNIAPPVVNISPQPVTVNTPDVHVDIAPAQVHIEMPQRSEIDQAEILERDDNRLAKVIRTNRGDFEITERDANGDAAKFKRRSAA